MLGYCNNLTKSISRSIDHLVYRLARSIAIAWRSMAQRFVAWRSMTQHGVARRCMAQHLHSVYHPQITRSIQQSIDRVKGRKCYAMLRMQCMLAFTQCVSCYIALMQPVILQLRISRLKYGCAHQGPSLIQIKVKLKLRSSDDGFKASK